MADCHHLFLCYLNLFLGDYCIGLFLADCRDLFFVIFIFFDELSVALSYIILFLCCFFIIVISFLTDCEDLIYISVYFCLFLCYFDFVFCHFIFILFFYCLIFD